MTTPVQRIRDLKLNDEDLGEIPTNNLYDIADAQFTKLLTGLAEFMDDYDDYWHTKDVADTLREVLGDAEAKE